MTDDERFAAAMEPGHFERVMEVRRERQRREAEERYFTKARREEGRKRKKLKQPLPTFTPM